MLALQSKLRTKAEQLRVDELQSLLRTIGAKPRSKKTELVEQFNQLIQGADATSLSVYDMLINESSGAPGVSSVIRPPPATTSIAAKQTATLPVSNQPQVSRPLPHNNLISRSLPQETVTMAKKAQNSLHDLNVGAVTLNIGSLSPPSSPVRDNLQQPRVPADVKFKHLPFYDLLSIVREPQTLDAFSLAAGRSQETNVSFALTNEQLSLIRREARFHVSLSYTEYVVQVQLRFCKIDAANSEQDDAFPSSISVQVNGKLVALPPLIPTNRVGVEPKRPGRALDVTEHCRMIPGSSNNLHISWAIDAAAFNNIRINPSIAYHPTHAFELFLVRKVSVDELMARIRLAPIITVDEARQLLVEKLRVANVEECETEAELAVASQSITVNLACPISKTRMRVAIRGRDCPHIQCFDAITFLTMNEKKPSWICPICDRAVPFGRLAIDELLQSVLDASTSRLIESIAFCHDGSWHDAKDDGGACMLTSSDEEDEANHSTNASTVNPGPTSAASAAVPLPALIPASVPDSAAAIRRESTAEQVRKSSSAPVSAARVSMNQSVIDLTGSDNEGDVQPAPSGSHTVVMLPRKISSPVTAATAAANVPSTNLNHNVPNSNVVAKKATVTRRPRASKQPRRNSTSSAEDSEDSLSESSDSESDASFLMSSPDARRSNRRGKRKAPARKSAQNSSNNTRAQKDLTDSRKSNGSKTDAVPRRRVRSAQIVNAMPKSARRVKSQATSAGRAAESGAHTRQQSRKSGLELSTSRRSDASDANPRPVSQSTRSNGHNGTPATPTPVNGIAAAAAQSRSSNNSAKETRSASALKRATSQEVAPVLSPQRTPTNARNELRSKRVSTAKHVQLNSR